MKKILLTFAGVLLAIGVQAQGTVNFANNASTAVSNILTGARVPAGNSFLAQLYYGPAGVAQADWATLQAVPNAPATFTLAGQVLAGARTTTLAGATTGSFQIRAWEASLGATWETAYNAYLNDPAMVGKVAGKSGIIQVKTADPSSVPPGTPTSLITGTGLTGFYLTPVPEPSVIALGALGLAALLYRRRK